MDDATPSPLQALLAETAWARRLARGLVVDRDDAEDLLAQGWLSALRHPPDARRSLRPWLATVLRRHRLDDLTARRRRAAREEEAAARAEAPESPEALVGRMQAQSQLAALVVALEEPYRQTVLLRYHEGLSAAQIARQLGIPAGTVRWRLKTGLDRLRAGMDERHEGERERWHRLLLPLVGVGPARRGKAGLAVAVAASVAAVLTTGVAAVLTAATVGWRAGAVGGGGGSDEGVVASAGRVPATTLRSAQPLACRDDVNALRREVAEAERDALGTLDAAARFDRGGTNPEAHRAMAPLVAEAMKAGPGEAPSYTFECAALACHLVVLTPVNDPGDSNDWLSALQDEGPLQRWSLGLRIGAAEEVTDPLSQTRMLRNDVYLKLDGPAVARAELTPVALGRDCEAEAAALRSRLAATRALVQANRPVEDLHKRARPDPALSGWVNAALRRILGHDSAPLADCRGLICRLDGQLEEDQRDLLAQDPTLTTRIAREECCRPFFYVMNSPAQMAAQAWLNQAAQEFVAGPSVGTCQDQHPASGRLTIYLEIPGADGRAMNLRLHGSLTDTPFARCLAEELARTTLHRTPPASDGPTSGEALLTLPRP